MYYVYPAMYQVYLTKLLVYLGISQYIIIGKISIMQGLEPQTLCTVHSCSYHCTTSVDTHSDFGWYKTVGHGIHLITSPAGWPGCRTSGAGPAAPPTPAMTSPALASTRTAGSPVRPGSGTRSKCSEEGHSGPTTGTGTVLVARASAMQVLPG